VRIAVIRKVGLDWSSIIYWEHYFTTQDLIRPPPLSVNFLDLRDRVLYLLDIYYNAHSLWQIGLEYRSRTHTGSTKGGNE